MKCSKLYKIDVISTRMDQAHRIEEKTAHCEEADGFCAAAL